MGYVLPKPVDVAFTRLREREGPENGSSRGNQDREKSCGKGIVARANEGGGKGLRFELRSYREALL